MNRRNWIQSAWAGLVTILLPSLVRGGEMSHPGGELDKWLTANSTIPGTAYVPKATVARRVMTWACVCVRRGAHWTIGAIGFGSASIGQVRHHLVSVHGHSYGELNGLSKEQLGNLHDAHHEGRTYQQYVIPATPANGVDRMTYSSGGCPGGVCPTPTRRRGLLARMFGG